MQSLEDEWGEYLSTNSKLQIAISKNQTLNINKESLFIKKQEIKQNQAWYNGWISEIKLTNINNSLVEISDSLIVIQNRIETLQDTKNTSMQIIKDKYNTYMLIADAPSMEENRLEFVINLSKLLDVSGFNSLPLPDYNSLIKNIWSDKKMKQLIYDDLLLIFACRTVAGDNRFLVSAIRRFCSSLVKRTSPQISWTLASIFGSPRLRSWRAV